MIQYKRDFDTGDVLSTHTYHFYPSAIDNDIDESQEDTYIDISVPRVNATSKNLIRRPSLIIEDMINKEFGIVSLSRKNINDKNYF